jgi:hypothetical protein
MIQSPEDGNNNRCLSFYSAVSRDFTSIADMGNFASGNTLGSTSLPSERPAGRFVRQLLLTQVLLSLFLLPAGFYVLFHTPAPLPGLQPFLAPGFENLLSLSQLFFLLADHLIKLGNKRLPGLQTGDRHNSLLVRPNLVAILLLVTFQVRYLITMRFHLLACFAHTVQSLLLLAFFQRQNRF